MDDQIGDRRQRRQCERREGDQADREGGSDADESAEIGNEIEDGGRRRPQQGIGEAEQGHHGADRAAESDIDDGDRQEVARDHVLDVVDDAQRTLGLAQAADDPHQLQQEQVSGRKQEDRQDERGAERGADARHRVGGPGEEARLGDDNALRVLRRRARGQFLDLPAGVGEEGNRTGKHLEALLELGDDGRGVGDHLREGAGERAATAMTAIPSSRTSRIALTAAGTPRRLR